MYFISISPALPPLTLQQKKNLVWYFKTAGFGQKGCGHTISNGKKNKPTKNSNGNTPYINSNIWIFSFKVQVLIAAINSDYS